MPSNGSTRDTDWPGVPGNGGSEPIPAEGRLAAAVTLRIATAMGRIARDYVILSRMQQIKCTADDRNKGWCVFCGGNDETRHRVPSRVFLDSPLPENLPTVAACDACNNSFSTDEEYMACLIECALSGTADDATRRPKIAAIFDRAPALKARLAAARYETDGKVGFLGRRSALE